MLIVELSAPASTPIQHAIFKNYKINVATSNNNNNTLLKFLNNGIIEDKKRMLYKIRRL